jgi:hypothetical protein
MTNYQKEQFMLEEQFVKRMLIDYDIREITTQRQAKNGFLYLATQNKDLSGLSVKNIT